MTDTYISSIQVSSVKFSDAQLIALGGPSANGIPVIVSVPPTEMSPVPLTIALNGNNLTLSWPVAATGFTLEGTDSLTTPITWTPVQNVSNNSVTFTIGAGNHFYRLRQ